MNSRKRCGTLIVIRPASSRPFRLRFTSNAFRLVVLASLISCLMVLIVRHSIRTLATDRDRARLAEENLQLKVKNQNAAIGRVQLINRVTQIEQQARRIEELLEEQQSAEHPEESLADIAQ
jgi:hypothetical protein